MLLPLLAALAAAGGYAVGRTRPGERLYSWADGHADGPHGPAWWAAQTIGAVALVWFLIAHPRRSAANLRANREYRANAGRRSPATTFDPNWAAHHTNTLREDKTP